MPGVLSWWRSCHTKRAPKQRGIFASGEEARPPKPLQHSPTYPAIYAHHNLVPRSLVDEAAFVSKRSGYQITHTSLRLIKKLLWEYPDPVVWRRLHVYPAYLVTKFSQCFSTSRYFDSRSESPLSHAFFLLMPNKRDAPVKSLANPNIGSRNIIKAIIIT